MVQQVQLFYIKKKVINETFYLKLDLFILSVRRSGIAILHGIYGPQGDFKISVKIMLRYVRQFKIF